MADQLPQYVVFQWSANTERPYYLHYLWSSEEFWNYYRGMGCSRDLPVVSPFVKLEVVRSTLHAGKFHLLCSYNNNYLEVVPHKDDPGLRILSATAARPVDDLDLPASTLFSVPALPRGTALHHDASRAGIVLDNTTGFARLGEPGNWTVFNYLSWESYQDKVGRKDEEIERLRGILVDFLGTPDGESLSPIDFIHELKQVVAEQDKQLEELHEQIGGGNKAVKTTTT